MKQPINEIKRMQRLAGIIKEALEDPYESPTSYDEQKEDDVNKVIDEMFQEEGVDLASPEREKAEKILQDVIFGRGSYMQGSYERELLGLQKMWDSNDIKDLGISIAVMALDL